MKSYIRLVDISEYIDKINLDFNKDEIEIEITHKLAYLAIKPNLYVVIESSVGKFQYKVVNCVLYEEDCAILRLRMTDCCWYSGIILKSSIN